MLWLNGTLLATTAARIDPADRGFLLGDGVFETIRAEAGEPRHLPRHLERLRDGAALLGIPVPTSDAEIAAAIAAVLDGFSRAAVRITLSRGPAARGVLPAADAAPTLLIAAAALPAPAPPARLIVATCTRRNECSPLSRIKSLNYLDGILARQEAAAAGADDALLLNTQGFVAEATAATLLVVLPAGEVVTPPVTDGALPGIWRARMVERGLASERRLRPADLAQVRAAVIGNSLGVRAVAAIGPHGLDPAGADARLLLEAGRD